MFVAGLSFPAAPYRVAKRTKRFSYNMMANVRVTEQCGVLLQWKRNNTFCVTELHITAKT